MSCIRPTFRLQSRMRFARFPVAVLFVAIVHPVTAGDPSKAVTFQGETSRWTFGAGITVRSVDADFHIGKPNPLPWQSLLRAQHASGRGDVGVYSGGTGAVHYSDGEVGPDYGAVYGGANPNGD